MSDDKVKLLKALGGDKLNWKTICSLLDKKDLKYLEDFASSIGIDTKNKSKKDLCMEISINYESAWVPKYKECPNVQLSGKSFDNVNSYLIIRDTLGKCYSLDDLLIISSSSSYEKTMVFENNLTMKQSIELLNKRHIQLEIDSKRREKELKNLQSPNHVKKAVSNPLKVFVEMINGTLNDTNTGYIKNLSRLIKESDLKTINNDMYDDVKHLVHKYDIYNETELLPFIEEKNGNEFFLGLIYVFDYIKDSEDYFNLEKLKTEISKILRSY